MRILIFHGYLLRGTGSNIYNASLVRAFARLGHQVELVCQERRADELDLPDAVTVTVPDIGGVLPVYVADRYEGYDAIPYADLDDAGVERYIEANVRAVSEVAERTKPDVALANHLVMGPVILARALGDRTPYAVKVHGSALEYTVRPNRERFLPYALEGVRGSQGVLVGSRHTAESLWEVLDEPGLPERTRLGPPGVDVHTFRPREPDEAAAGLRRLAGRLESGAAAEWGGEADAAAALASLDPSRDRIVSYVGKLIVSKGVDLLLAAWPLVVSRVPDARLVIVGFGTYRETLGRYVDALRRADLDVLRDIAARGRELEGGPPGRLAHLESFLGRVDEEWLRAAPLAAERVHFTGRLEHEDLPDLLPACEAQVMSSTFPEAFGMVAAEAAAAGSPPLVARHSGLAEIADGLEEEYPPHLRHLASFATGDAADLASKLKELLALDGPDRAAVREAARNATVARWSWAGVARRLLEPFNYAPADG